MRATKLLTVLTATFAIIGCASTNHVGLAYKPTMAIVTRESPSIALSVGSFVDQRGNAATWLGAIRGGYGNPLKKLEVTPSVAALVQTAFTEGLRVRGLHVQDRGAAYQISGVIRRLDCSQYVRREAHAVIDVTVFNAATGKQVFTRTYTADEVEGSLLALNTGIFASVESLRGLAEKVLGQVVDKALDDTALGNSMRET